MKNRHPQTLSDSDQRIEIPVKKIRQLPHRWQQRTLVRLALDGLEIPDWLLTPIDYDYRPRSYWKLPIETLIVANVKGAECKRRVVELLESARVDEADEFYLSAGLDEPTRSIAGQIDPMNMGGEYLPEYMEAEIEIARITLM